MYLQRNLNAPGVSLLLIISCVLASPVKLTLHPVTPPLAIKRKIRLLCNIVGDSSLKNRHESAWMGSVTNVPERVINSPELTFRSKYSTPGTIVVSTCMTLFCAWVVVQRHSAKTDTMIFSCLIDLHFGRTGSLLLATRTLFTWLAFSSWFLFWLCFSLSRVLFGSFYFLCSLFWGFSFFRH